MNLWMVQSPTALLAYDDLSLTYGVIVRRWLRRLVPAPYGRLSYIRCENDALPVLSLLSPFPIAERRETEEALIFQTLFLPALYLCLSLFFASLSAFVSVFVCLSLTFCLCLCLTFGPNTLLGPPSRHIFRRQSKGNSKTNHHQYTQNHSCADHAIVKTCVRSALFTARPSVPFVFSWQLRLRSV